MGAVPPEVFLRPILPALVPMATGIAEEPALSDILTLNVSDSDPSESLPKGVSR